jgi:diadenosine tetraphosphate (Ap4A) HIT family hydrolase/CTP:molybdopterin cytidylyltransferase MocA
MTRWVSLILAAGKGTRMRSDLAKVLHELRGRTLLANVLDTVGRLSPARTVVVVGHQAELVRSLHAHFCVETVLQEPQLGTGHAVMMAAPLLQDEPEGTSLLLLYGDVPLLRPGTLLELMERHLLEGNGATVLSARVPDPTGYGRILRTSDNRFQRIVEDRDLEPSDRGNSEINSGIYAFHLKSLLDALGGLRADNAQREYYLTDTLHLIQEGGKPVGVFCLEDPEEVSGINTVEQLAAAEAILERRAGEPESCPVCQLLAGEADLSLCRRDGLAVFLAPYPYNSGHLWVVPERHLTCFESLAPGEARALLALGAEVEAWCQESFHPQAMNLGYNSGRPGEHLALHIVPRWAGDSNFMPLIGGVNILPETLEATRHRILQSKERLERKGGSRPGEEDRK